MMAAPLIAGNDLTTMSPATRETLTHPEVIAVDQDPLGNQGTRVRDDGDLEVWSKQLQGDGVRAVALFNRGGAEAPVTVRWSEVGLRDDGVSVRDLWARADRGTVATQFTATVPAHGVVLLRVDGTERQPVVDVAVPDPRTITDLQVTAEFTVVGDTHLDAEWVGALNGPVDLTLDGNGATWDATAGRWTGDMLRTGARSQGTRRLTVTRTDPRAMPHLRLTVQFRVDGQPHLDWQDFGPVVGDVRLVLDANGGSFDGTNWVGDFLRPA